MNRENLTTIWANRSAPLNELHQEMNRLLDDFRFTASTKVWRNSEAEWTPACDVEEKSDHYLLTLDMPGVQKDQFKLEIIDNQLTISGERNQEVKDKGEGFWYSERRHGKFSRTFTIPPGVDGDKVEAHYQDGTLQVYVPKPATAKPRQIKISHGTGTGFFGRLMGQRTTKDLEDRYSPGDQGKAAS